MTNNKIPNTECQAIIPNVEQQPKPKTTKKPKKATGSPRGTNFAFTDFALADKHKIFAEHHEDVRGIAWSLEVCPKTGRQHHQGYIQLFTRSRYGKIKAILGDTVHVEAMRGSILDNQTYCAKASTLNQLGSFVKERKRTDIDTIKQMIADGKPMIEVMESNPSLYLRYHSGFDKIQAMYDQKRRTEDRDIETYVLIGESGTGKTHYVMKTMSNPEDVFVVDSGASSQFPFDGYQGEATLLIDDYDGWIKYSYLLRVLDKYKLRLNIKGSYTYAAWTRVYITSNVRPTYWYDTVANTENLQRRINGIYEVTRNNGQGTLITRDKRWAFDRVGNTLYEGNTY